MQSDLKGAIRAHPWLKRSIEVAIMVLFNCYQFWLVESYYHLHFMLMGKNTHTMKQAQLTLCHAADGDGTPAWNPSHTFGVWSVLCATASRLLRD